MDNEWLKYFQKIEDLGIEEDIDQKKDEVLEEAMELYDSVLNEDN